MFNFERLLDCLNRNYINPADIYLFKINNVNTRSMHGIRSKLIKTAEWKDAINVVSVSFLLTLNRFHTLFQCFHCWIWNAGCRGFTVEYFVRHKRVDVFALFGTTSFLPLLMYWTKYSRMNQVKFVEDSL